MMAAQRKNHQLKTRHEKTLAINQKASYQSGRKIMKQIRINLEVAEEYRERLRKLQSETGATTQAEVLRKAIALFEAVNQIKSQGGKLKVEYPNGTIDTIIFFP